MKYSLRSAILLFSFFLFPFSFPSLSWAQTGRITGQVTAQDTGGPLPGANIEVLGPNLVRKMGATTGADGRYTVENVPAGTYTVKATFVGYLDAAVTDIVVGGGDSVEVRIGMLASPYELEKIVVSASRRAENIVDAPVTISKVGWKEIRKNTIGSAYLSDLKYVKSIDYHQIGIFQERYNTRGYNSAFNVRMLLLTDGRVTRTFGGNPLYGPTITRDDLQAMEVIVGPGSALYGPDAISGVISLMSKDPRDFQGTRLAVAGGSRNLLKGRFRHAELTGKWGWKVSGEYQRGRDFELITTFYNTDSTASVTGDPDFDANFLTGGLGLFYYPDHQSRFAFTAGLTRMNQIFFNPAGRNQTKNYVYHYQQMTCTTPNLYLNIYRTGDTSGDSFGLDRKAAFLLAGLPAEEAEERARDESDGSFWEGEARYTLHFPHLKNTRFTLGSNLRHERTAGNVFAGGKAAAHLVGFYGHTKTDLNAKLRAVLAARIDLHEIYHTQFSPQAALIFKPEPGIAFRFTFNRAFKSPTLLEQKAELPLGQFLVARGNSKGFRFGSLTGNPLSPQYAAGIPKLKPEENTTFEFGFKGILANRVFLDLTGYRSRYKDFISDVLPIGDLRSGVVTLDENGNPRAGEQTLSLINFGKQTVLGGDVGVNVYATDRLLLKGNASFIKTDDLEDAQGLNVPFNTPEAMLNIGLSMSDFVTRGISLDLSLRHIVEHDYRSGPHAGTLPAYTVVDINVGYRTRVGVACRVSAHNILNNRHREFVTGPEIGRIVVGEVAYGF